ncbi:MAG: substrate-binding domain-containing protein [Streptosporangiaceae bacterium]|nr:substrate-binding domain-containing protein [Streptosporangiaceae bacterium]
MAQHARVAVKTVSRVVNGEPGVRPQMAERVQQSITELGYRRNDGARVLRRGQTASIGLILENIGDPFYATLSRAVEDVAARHHALLITGSSDEDPDRERTLALAFCARRVDGLIIIPASRDHTYLEPEIAHGCAVVFVDRPPRLIEADTVLTGNRDGAASGVAHLIGNGHRRIGFIGDDSRIYTAAQRHQGYRDAMAAAGLAVADSWITMASPSPSGVGAALDRMLTGAAAGGPGQLGAAAGGPGQLGAAAGGPGQFGAAAGGPGQFGAAAGGPGQLGTAPVTAVFCGNNRVTALALRELRSARASVALVGFDDLELADLLEPGVTVVAQNTGELGRIAAEMLFRRLNGYHGPPETIELPTTLIPRGSGELPPSGLTHLTTLISRGSPELPPPI